MIDWDGMAELLAFMAVFDNRKGGELDVKAWLAVAQAQDWDRPVVERIITDHYGSGAERPRLNPAMVTDRHRALRAAAADGFVPPRFASDDDGGPVDAAQYRAALRAHVDAGLTRWAQTGEEPRAVTAPAVVSTVAELASAAPEHLRDELRQAAHRLGRRP